MMKRSWMKDEGSSGFASQWQNTAPDKKIFLALLTSAGLAILLALGVAYMSFNQAPDSVQPVKLTLSATGSMLLLFGLTWWLSTRLAENLRPSMASSEALEQGLAAAPVSREEWQRLQHELTIYKDIFDDAPVCYHELNADGVLMRVNHTELALLGYSAEEMIGHHPSEFILEKSSRDAIAKKLSGEVPLQAFERHFICKDGSLLPVLAEDRLIRDADGKVNGIRTTLQNIKARKEVEKALARERDLLHTLLTHIPDCIYFKDLAGRFIRINQGLAELLDLENPDDAVGKSDFDFYPSDMAKEALASEQEFIKAGKPLLNCVEQIIKPNGEARWMMTTKVPIQSQEGEFTGLVAISKDITERKLAEEQLAQNLEAFLEVVNAVAKGDLRRRGVEGENTLGSIAVAFNKMLEDFSTMLLQVKQMGVMVSSSAVQIHTASDQIAAGAQRQTQEISNISSAINEMAASMSQVSRNAVNSSDAARLALEKAALGNQSAFDTSAAMSQIENAVQVTAEKMRLLGERSSKISEVIDLIDEIATQTNLLSLNAAIEAAHAGQAGLGFSVVADEIRKLADRTGRATKDVSKLIRAIQEETAEALEAMGQGKERVTAGRQLAEHASQSLSEIAAAVKQSAELIEEISVASEEHARVTNDLANVMQSVSNITYETSASAHQTASTVKGMVELSDQLNDSMVMFKIKDAPVSHYAMNPVNNREARVSD
ncbi:MAG: PAS domain-containing methyl-accepting chemotaxis protein [Acidobacteria bacterium]|nr:PAS domain-containing methyl-accepting chemotaxis protein [Acidobacteriota bacterium]